jgi:hypothetical protein
MSPLCPNCGHLLHTEPEPRPKYCPACGQETNIKAPTVGEFMQQFSGTYFATEGALWRTLKLLLLKPGELTVQYLAGRRKHYVLPLRLFLSVTVVMLLVMRIVSAIQYSDFDDPAVLRALPERPGSIELNLGFGHAGVSDGVFYCDGLPAWMCRRVQQRLDQDTSMLMLQAQKAVERIASHAGIVMLVLLPAFAFGLWVLFRYRGLYYTEHLVFALHLHAFWFLVVALMMTNWLPLVVFGLLAIPAYGWVAFARVYGGPWWSRLVRILGLSAVHGTLVAAAVAAVTLAALLL